MAQPSSSISTTGHPESLGGHAWAWISAPSLPAPAEVRFSPVTSERAGKEEQGGCQMGTVGNGLVGELKHSGRHPDELGETWTGG